MSRYIYPDLLTQRLLNAALANSAVPYPQEQLAALGGIVRLRKITQRRSSDGEKILGALLLRERVGQRFDAIVTGAAAKGLG